MVGIVSFCGGWPGEGDRLFGLSLRGRDDRIREVGAHCLDDRKGVEEIFS